MILSFYSKSEYSVNRNERVLQKMFMMQSADRIFRRGDILIPKGNLDKWAVVACDQFSSDIPYWEDVEKIAGEYPSAYKLIIPEAYLGFADIGRETVRINMTMDSYLNAGVFSELKDSFVYTERTLCSGKVRKGLLGLLDLEAYDWREGSDTPVRATEGTIEARLPARVSIRRNAPLEIPHIIVFINDTSGDIISDDDSYETVYDIELMKNGGSVRGKRVEGDKAKELEEKIAALYTEKGQIVFAIGDGNHSLAAAKAHWEEKKKSLGDDRAKEDPARFALVELENIHDPGVVFEPIHRVIFNTDASAFVKEFEKYCLGLQGRNYIVTAASGKDKYELTVPSLSYGALIENCESFCRDYALSRGGRIDYIHGDPEALEFASVPGNAGLILPGMEKEELFSSVAAFGPFPKKSFSVGLGADKRYYLESRKLK